METTLGEKILEIVNSIRKNKNENNLENIVPEMLLREDLGLDSFDMAELTVKIEDEFDVDIFEDGIVLTVDEIYKKLR